MIQIDTAAWAADGGLDKANKDHFNGEGLNLVLLGSGALVLAERPHTGRGRAKPSEWRRKVKVVEPAPAEEPTEGAMDGPVPAPPPMETGIAPTVTQEGEAAPDAGPTGF